MVLRRHLGINLLLLVERPSRTGTDAVVVLLRHPWHWVRVAGDARDDATAVRAVSVVLGIVGFAVFVAALAFVEECVCLRVILAASCISFSFPN